MTSEPTFSIWSGVIGTETGWREIDATDDLAEAMRLCERVGVGPVQGIIYERGTFAIDGRPFNDFVAFYWSRNSWAAEGQPEGRGVGWYEEEKQEILYRPAMAGDLVSSHQTILNAPIVAIPVRSNAMPVQAEPQEHASIQCAHCAKMVPPSQTRERRYWNAVRRTSGTFRTSSSQSQRIGSRSSSTTYRHGQSSTSGTTTWKQDVERLCLSCYDRQRSWDSLVFWGKAALCLAVVAFFVWQVYRK